MDKKKKSILESFLRGGGQGLTLGNSDELTGIIKSLTNDSIIDTYEVDRDEDRIANQEAETDNPITYRVAKGIGHQGINTLLNFLMPLNTVGTQLATKGLRDIGEAGEVPTAEELKRKREILQRLIDKEKTH